MRVAYDTPSMLLSVVKVFIDGCSFCIELLLFEQMAVSSQIDPMVKRRVSWEKPY